MNLATRFLIALFSVMFGCAFLFYDMVVDQIELGISQSTEETMVDTANLLAELAESEFKDGSIANGNLHEAATEYSARTLNAAIFDIVKTETSFRIYVTDDEGKVVYDSYGKDTGSDFSRWNDIYLTLRGEYGARATRQDPDDDLTTILHVAAPIKVGDNIIGVVSVAKSKLSLRPYVERVRTTMLRNGVLVFLLSVVICLLLAFWLTGSIRKLVTYADSIADKTTPTPPAFSEPEFRQLAEAIRAMRHRLDGKEYVEEYVHSLTHEIKSPVAAAKGALELLDSSMPAEDRERFLANIKHEVERLEAIANRLLELAELEHMDHLDNPQELDLATILDEQVTLRSLQFENKGVEVYQSSQAAVVSGDAFLLKQAISNLLDNALNHAPKGSRVEICLSTDPTTISIRDYGPGIPDYARERVFDRFYSLPNPSTGKKSSGLGLSFVKQIADLHGASILVLNRQLGTEIQMSFRHT